MLASWIFGAFVLVLLVALHWFAYRVGNSRNSRHRAAGRAHRVGRRDVVRNDGPIVTNEPLRPR